LDDQSHPSGRVIAVDAENIHACRPSGHIEFQHITGKNVLFYDATCCIRNNESRWAKTAVAL
jgi:hypothetical protein